MLQDEELLNMFHGMQTWYCILFAFIVCCPTFPQYTLTVPQNVKAY